MVVWRGVQSGCGVFVQTCNKTHSDRPPVVYSPQCWGMVSSSFIKFNFLYSARSQQKSFKVTVPIEHIYTFLLLFY